MFIYGANIQYPYHWDDYRTIVDNPALADPFRLNEVFSFWPTRAFLFWTFFLNNTVGGYTLSAYHLTNIAVHLATAIILYLLIFRTLMTGRTGLSGIAETVETVNNPDYRKEYAWIASLATLLFVAHPVATEAVTYLIQRGVALSAALGLFSLLSYTYSRGIFFREGRRFLSPLHLFLYGLSIILLVLSMLTKEGAVVFPILIICWELVFGEKTQKHSANNGTEALPAKVRSAGLQPCPTKAEMKSRTTSNHRTGYQMFTKRLSFRSRFLYLFPLVLTIAIIPILSLTTTKSAGLQDYILYRINRPWRPVSVTFIDGGEGSYLANSWEYFLTQLKSISIYIRLSFVPIRQNFTIISRLAVAYSRGIPSFSCWVI